METGNSEHFKHAYDGQPVEKIEPVNADLIIDQERDDSQDTHRGIVLQNVRRGTGEVRPGYDANDIAWYGSECHERGARHAHRNRKCLKKEWNGALIFGML